MPIGLDWGKMLKNRHNCLYSLLMVLGILVVAQLPVVAMANSETSQDKRLVADNLFDVDFIDAQRGLASGYYGTILKTRDGGAHWVRIDTNIKELIRRLDLVTADRGWAVGHRGSIFHTEDGGLSWQKQFQVKGVYLRDISFASENTGWAVGQNMTILNTRDGGKTWQQQKLTGFKGRDLPRLNGVLALSETTAVLVGEFGVVGYTDDGGANWRILPSGMGTTLTALAQRGQDVVVGGLDGVALNVSLGATPVVTSLNTGVHQHIFGISFNGKGQGIAVGRTIILRFDGDSITPVKADDSVILPYRWYHGVQILDDGQVIAVGARGAIIKTDSLQDEFRKIAQLGDPDTVSVGGEVKSEEQ
ncbi:MAG TPA: hypothetical protein ENI91_07665 [Sphingomonadales bacterium]|nr:hypothetical protein [Sphingomonadales bacterium]